MTSLIDAESILVIEVGSIHTRAILFDVVEGRYRFIARGIAKSTAVMPFRNIGEGVRLAIDHLQDITGRKLVDPNHNLIIPSPGDGSGVDRFAATISAGEPLNVIVVGLLEDVSAESAHRLAESTYDYILERISLNDRRKPDSRLNLIIQSRPDLVVVAGGTNGGATQSLISLMDTVGMACYLMPESERPQILFAGNQDLGERIESNLQGITSVQFAPNIRPALEIERLDPARSVIARLYTENRLRRLVGVADLKKWSGEGLMPSSTAFARVVRFLSSFLRDKKGVLGIDIGASAAVVAAAMEGDLSLSVFPQLGLGTGAQKLLDTLGEQAVLRWLTLEIPARQVRAYLLNKSIHPGAIPASDEELDIEQAVARQVLQEAVRLSRPGLPKHLSSIGEACLPLFEPILASGSVLAQAPGIAHSALLLLDGLQPVGITTLVLDQNQIAPAIGAAAIFNPLLAVQVMDSNSFLNIGTVIAPVVNVKTAQPVLRMKVTYESGHEAIHEVKKGSLEVLSIPYGQTARLVVHPLHRANIGMGAPGRGGAITVRGGTLGVIIDARGRPLPISKDVHKRRELQTKWLWTLGGQ